jgi:hypothetical protein
LLLPQFHNTLTAEVGGSQSPANPALQPTHNENKQDSVISIYSERPAPHEEKGVYEDGGLFIPPVTRLWASFFLLDQTGFLPGG